MRQGALAGVHSTAPRGAHAGVRLGSVRLPALMFGLDNASVRTAAVVLAAAIPLAGCGQKTIKQSGAEQSVANVVAEQTGFRPTDVKCPSGVEAKVGNVFDCHFTGPEPKPYIAHVRITKVQGERVVFFVNSRPSG